MKLPAIILLFLLMFFPSFSHAQSEFERITPQQTIDTGPDKIISMAASEDDRFIATGDKHGIIKLWRTDNGELIGELKGHSLDVLSLDFSNDEKYLVSGGWDDTVRLWTINPLQQVALLEGHMSEVTKVQFSPDGKYVVSRSNDGSIRIWSINNLKCIQTLRPEQDNKRSYFPKNVKFDFSHDGKHFVTTLGGGSRDTSRFLAIELESGTRVRTTKIYPLVHAFKFFNDGSLLACTNDSIIRIEDFINKKSAEAKTEQDNSTEIDYISSDHFDNTRLNKSQHTIELADLSPDGKLIVTGYNGKIVFWSVTSGVNLASFQQSDSNIIHLDFSRDGKKLYIGQSDGKIEICKIDSEKWPPHPDPLSKMRIPDLVKSIPTSERPDRHSQPVICIALSPSGDLFATGSRDKTIRIWRTKNGEFVRSFSGFSDPISSLAFSHDGKFIAAGCDKKLIIRYVNSDKVYQSFDLNSEILSLAYQEKTNIPLVALNDGSIRLVNSTGVVKTTELEINDNGTVISGQILDENATFSRDGRYLACGSYRGLITLWQVENGQGYVLQARSRPDFAARNSTIIFSNDGKLIAHGGFLTRIYSADIGKLIAEFAGTGRAISSFRNFVALEDVQHNLIIKEIESGQIHKVINPEKYWCQCASFSQDGKKLIVVGRDQAIMIWSVDTAELEHIY